MSLNIGERLRSFFASSRRIFIISKKPSRKEYYTMIKIVALGFVIIGVIGFVIYITFALLGIGA